MTVTRGKRNVFLGMEIAFIDDGTVSIKMKDHIVDAIAEFSEDVSKPSTRAGQKKFV